MAKWFVFLGALNGLLSVALGAFGAHALKDRLSTSMRSVYETAVQYEMAHALALLFVGMFARYYPQSALLTWSGWLFFIGIILFSGSLYLLAITGVKGLGAITPLGGVAFLAGWVCVAVAALRH